MQNTKPPAKSSKRRKPIISSRLKMLPGISEVGAAGLGSAAKGIGLSIRWRSIRPNLWYGTDLPMG